MTTVSRPSSWFFSDSWGNPKYFKCPQLVSQNGRYIDTIRIDPHRVVNLNKFEVHFSLGWINRAIPGLSMDKLLNNYADELISWARNLPIVTVIHLGAVDVNNRVVGETGKEYGDYVFDFLEQMIESAQVTLSDQEKAIFLRKLQNDHRFLWLGLPDWGMEYTPKYDNSMTPAQYKKARRRINSAMKKNQAKLWRMYKGIIFTPMLSHPQRNNVHLSASDARKFARQIAVVVSRLSCTYCRIEMSGKFKKCQHAAKALKSEGCNLS